MTAQKSRTDAALAALPVAQRNYWTPRFHHVTTRAAGVGGWPQQLFTQRAAGPGWATAFAIDPLQHLRTIGLLYYVTGGAGSPAMSWIANDVRWQAQQKEVARQVNAETATEIVVFQDQFVGGTQVDVTVVAHLTIRRRPKARM